MKFHFGRVFLASVSLIVLAAAQQANSNLKTASTQLVQPLVQFGGVGGATPIQTPDLEPLGSRNGEDFNADASGLPRDARSSISAALGRDIPGYQARAQGTGFEAQNLRHMLAIDFTSDGVAVRKRGASWKLALRAYGYSGDLEAVDEAAPQARTNRVEYRRGSLTEWYVNGPLGLEQGFTITEPPPGAVDGQPLTIALELSGDLTAAVDQDGRSLTLIDREGNPDMRYAGLASRDATGREMRSWLEVQGSQLLLKVADAGARYPVVVDPLVQAKLTASDGAANDLLGFSVSISGNTVVVGALQASPGFVNQGSVYVFVKPASGWANMTQTAELTASDGMTGDLLGTGVSISGNTVVAGAILASIGNNVSQGAVYVFVKPASGWQNMNQTAKLTASDGAANDNLGRSVSISGNTVMAGAPGATIGSNSLEGAAYVFVKPASGWKDMTQTAKLTASDGLANGSVGFSVAINGVTAVAGEPDGITGDIAGAAYVFVKPVSGWKDMTQTAKLTNSDGFPDNLLGVSVAVSGNTVVAGASNTSAGGTAYVYVEPARGWVNMTQTAELTALHGAPPDGLGASVSISGNVVVAGAPYTTVGSNSEQGAAYAFVKPATGWKNMTQTLKVTASDGAANDLFGYSIAVSGKTAVSGSPQATIGSNAQQGAAYVYGP
jgi:trimeric autotransporter adhesin